MGAVVISDDSTVCSHKNLLTKRDRVYAPTGNQPYVVSSFQCEMSPHVFEHFVPSSWKFGGGYGTFRRWTFNGTSRSSGKLWELLARSSF